MKPTVPWSHLCTLICTFFIQVFTYIPCISNVAASLHSFLEYHLTNLTRFSPRKFFSSNFYPQTLSVCQLSYYLSWGEGGEEMATLVGSVGRWGDVLFFIGKTYSCWELMFASYYYRSINIVRLRATVAVVTVTRTPTLQTRQNWHNHLPNKSIVRYGKPFFFQNG
jgi:hypothetical protein